MKSVLLLLCVFSSSLLAQEEVPTKKPEKPKLLEVGGVVPEDLLLIDIDGHQTRMKDLRGKVVFFAWYSFNCPALRSAGPKINQLAKKYVSAKDVAVFTINKINSWWIDLIVGVFVLFALISFETGFFTSEKEIRELTEEGPISKDTKEKLVDRF